MVLTGAVMPLVFTETDGQLIDLPLASALAKQREILIPPIRNTFLPGFADLMKAGVSDITLVILGDSTGAGLTAWPFLLAQNLASKFPAYTVRFRAWDTGNNWMPSNSIATIQTGLSGAKGWAVGATGVQFDTTNYAHPVGDMSIRIKCDPGANTWTPTATTELFGKANSSSQGIRVGITNAGALYLRWWNGSAQISPSVSSAIVSTIGGNTGVKWIRADVDVDNGAAGNDTKYYVSTDDGITWTQLGTTITTASTTVIADVAGGTFLSTGENASGTISGIATGWTFYNVDWRKGLNGSAIIPDTLNIWNPRSAGGSTMSGSPTLDVVAAGMTSSASFSSYWDVGTNLANGLIFGHPTFVIINDGHNDANFGTTQLAAWASVYAKILAIDPAACVGVTTQNPETVAANSIHRSRMRSAMQMAWASRYGLSFCDAHAAFEKDGRPLSTLLQGDGVTPSVAYGYPMWAKTIEKALIP